MTRPKGHFLPDIAICIPVRDEAAELPGLFDALEGLYRRGAGIIHVCLLLDGCTDDSAALVAAYGTSSRHTVTIGKVATSTSNAGRARRLAMELGLNAIAADDGLLLTTDADSRPATDWVCRMEATLGLASVVVGRIVRPMYGTGHPEAASALQDRIERYYDALLALRRCLDPVPWEAQDTHHFTGGANMGFRAQAYRALGGFQPLASGEDARLIDDAGRAGLSVRRDGSCVVLTSARRQGRADGGLALSLRRCDDCDAASMRVAHPQDAAWQYRCHAIARHGFTSHDWSPIGDATGLGRDHVRGVARDCPNGEAFAMRIVPCPPGGMRHLTLPEAEIALAALCADRRAA